MNNAIPIVFAAIVTGMFGVLAVIVGRRRPPPRRIAEIIDARTQWLVDQLQEELNHANQDRKDLMKKIEGLDQTIQSLRERVNTLLLETETLRARITILLTKISDMEKKDNYSSESSSSPSSSSLSKKSDTTS